MMHGVYENKTIDSSVTDPYGTPLPPSLISLPMSYLHSYQKLSLNCYCYKVFPHTRVFSFLSGFLSSNLTRCTESMMPTDGEKWVGLAKVSGVKVRTVG